MTRFFVFFVLISLELCSSDHAIGAMAQTSESEEVTSNGYVMSGRTFDYLKNEISEKLASKLSSQLISPVSKPGNVASADLTTGPLVEDVKKPLINVTEDGFGVYEKTFPHFGEWWDNLLALLPSEIPHDPVASDDETLTRNLTESNRSEDSSNKIFT